MKKGIGLGLAPLLAGVLATLGGWISNAEAVCFSQLDLSTPGLVCAQGLGLNLLLFLVLQILLVLPICAALWGLNRIFVTVSIVRAAAIAGSLAVLVCVVWGLVELDGRAVLAVNLLSFITPLLVALVVSLYATPVALASELNGTTERSVVT